MSGRASVRLGIHFSFLLGAIVSLVLIVGVPEVGNSWPFAKPTPTPDPYLAQLDRYQSAAKAMNDLAKQRLQRIRADVLDLKRRIASETVGKRYIASDPHKNLGGCFQFGCPIFGPSEVACPRREMATYKSVDLDAAFAHPLAFLDQAQKDLNDRLNQYLDKLNKTRQTITNAEAAAEKAKSSYGANSSLIVQNQERYRFQAAQLAQWDYDQYCRAVYQVVVSAYAEQILLKLSEMGTSTGEENAHEHRRFTSPLGIACQIMSQVQDVERTDEEPVGPLRWQAESADSPERDRLWKEADELSATCDQREEKDLAAMAASLRDLRNRFLSERGQIGAAMVQWRKDCIANHFYDGEGEARISAVYGSEADLGKENLANLRFPFDDIHDFLEKSDFSPYQGLYLHNDFRLPRMKPHDECGKWARNTNWPGWTTDVLKVYPDLCKQMLDSDDCLQATEEAPKIEEAIVSGASDQERP